MRDQRAAFRPSAAAREFGERAAAESLRLETRNRVRRAAERAGAAAVAARSVGRLAHTAGVDHENESAPLHVPTSELKAYPSFVCARMRVKVDVAQPLGRQVRVDLGRGDVGVPEHLLQRA